MSRQPGDLVAAVVVAATCGVLTLLTPGDSAVRLVVALPLVFVLPGYAITAALFLRRSLRIPEQVLCSVGLSLVVVIMGGFALHWTPWGLRAESWAIFLFCVTLGASVIARMRRRRGRPVAATPLNVGLDSRQGLLLGLAALVIAAAVGLARTPMPPQGIQGYTLLWILPASDGNPNAVRLGVSSREFTPTEYRLQVLVDGQIAQEWPALQLAPGEDWETAASVPGNSSNTHTVEAMLYRLDAPNDVYRRVTLRLGN